MANFVLVLAVELVALPVFGDLLQCPHGRAQFWPLLLVLALGTWGMTVIGTIFSALTVNIRLREVMLPMLIYPILIPALMGAMQLTSGPGGGQADHAGHDRLAENADRLRCDVYCGLAGLGGDGFGGVKTMRDKILYVLGVVGRASAGARHHTLIARPAAGSARRA